MAAGIDPRVSASGAWLIEHATPRRKRGGVPRPASTAVTYAANTVSAGLHRPSHGTGKPTRQPCRLQAVARAPILWKVELDTSYVCT
jgi:hypothetical protein